jgi:polyhydroxyalkanoate synthase
MAAANHSYYLRNCYLENNLSGGTMELGGRKLSLSDIKIPVFNQASREDHIAPLRSVFFGSRYFGGDVEFLLAGSGHIAGVVNPPAANKYQYWTGARPAGALEDWLASAHEHPGSWWPYWQSWIERHDDERVPARKPGRKLKPLGDAPGAYVTARV